MAASDALKFEDNLVAHTLAITVIEAIKLRKIKNRLRITHGETANEDAANANEAPFGTAFWQAPPAGTRR